MRRSLAFLALAAIGLGLAACGRSGEQSSGNAARDSGAAGKTPAAGDAAAKAPMPIAVSEADSGRTLSAELGAEVVITLPTTPGTGYGWTMADSATAVLLLVESIVAPPDTTAAARVGAPTTATWRFRSVRVGTGTVRLESRRPWEKDAPAARHFDVHVEVR